VSGERVSRRDLLAGLGLALSASGLGRSISNAAAAPAPPSGGSDADMKIAFLGDSMIDGVWGGVLRLVSKEPCLASKIKPLRFGENGTGLTRPAKFDWIGEAKTIVAAQPLTLAVISLGLNDRQSIIDLDRARFDLGTPGWRNRYMELVAGLAKIAAQAKGGVLWLGIPVLRDQVSQQDAAEKNQIFADAIGSLKDPRVRFVDPWRQAPSGPDAFQPYGPDVSGSRVQIRVSDGIHFTQAGYDVVARYVFGKIADHLNAQGIPLTYPCGT
jgi:hypothetical protein